MKWFTVEIKSMSKLQLVNIANCINSGYYKVAAELAQAIVAEIDKRDALEDERELHRECECCW